MEIVCIAIEVLIIYYYALKLYSYYKGKKFEYDHAIAGKYFSCDTYTDSKEYPRYYILGIISSLLLIISSFAKFDWLIGKILIYISLIYSFGFALVYILKFEKCIIAADSAESLCMNMIASIALSLSASNILSIHSYIFYDSSVDTKDALAIRIIYFCFKEDRKRMLLDVAPLGVSAIMIILRFCSLSQYY